MRQAHPHIRRYSNTELVAVRILETIRRRAMGIYQAKDRVQLRCQWRQIQKARKSRMR